MLNYHFCGYDDDIIYSIDNIRLEFDLKYEKNFKLFCMKLDYFNLIEDKDFEIKNFTNLKTFKYKFMYNFKNKLDDTSFTFGFCFNNGNKTNYKGFVDFNPNKISKWKYFKMFMEKCRICFKDIDIKRYDLAVDIPVARTFVKLIKDKRSYHYLQDRSITEYLGKRNNNNFVKVYDKKAESNLDYELTRVELTIEPKEVMMFPKIQVRRLQNELLLIQLNSTDKVIYDLLCAVEEPYHYIQMFPQRKRAKFKEIMETMYKPFLFNVQLKEKLYMDIYRVYVIGENENVVLGNINLYDFEDSLQNSPFEMGE